MERMNTNWQSEKYIFERYNESEENGAPVIDGFGCSYYSGNKLSKIDVNLEQICHDITLHSIISTDKVGAHSMEVLPYNNNSLQSLGS